ncbi:TetR/AcrR family transcriptional regulator [Nonomuraea jiangxiensis]|uniref:DNA-binding transcriptional regulator, AcrR family n=1 Tax=Nonomuraea jiangxiensis TaxID=633440 RepID=A0A1G8G3U7_9ACTN|nr:TetR/AcrR family transcriptional regulator [Nonomuraea jiangxiensis]SDH88916.1 DNA-binding transcriptional regulator, AcrR family [Nonomuraea jiangxiensis]
MTVTGRADARRNRAQLLAAAQAAFAEEGLSVPLDAIARRAGVGAGTVYRHFPNKEALFAAVVSERVGLLVEEIAALAGTIGRADPGAAFFAAFERSVEQVAYNKALCESLASDARARVAPDARDRYRAALAALLSRAQEAGAVRPDVTAAEVTSLVAGCAAMAGFTTAGSGRTTSIVMDGLRPASATVTKPNEICCAECGAPVPAAGTGRPARYCGNACRQRAHRRRHTPA